MIFKYNKYFSMILSVFVVGPVNMIGFLFSMVLPKQSDLYLDNVILARKVSDV